MRFLMNCCLGKSYDLVYTVCCREWLQVLASLTEKLLALFQKLQHCQDHRAPLSVLIAYSKLWEYCPLILKALDAFTFLYPNGLVTDSSFQSMTLGCQQDVAVYTEMIPQVWDVLHRALSLSSMDPELGLSSGRGNLTAMVMAFQSIAEHCKCVSASCAPQVLERLLVYASREDLFRHQIAYGNIPRSCFLSTAGGAKYYGMMAKYLKLIGTNGCGSDVMKDEALQVVFRDILSPLEVLFERISFAGNAGQATQEQLELLSDNLVYLFTVYSRLKGFIQPLKEDRVFSTYILNIVHFLFNMLDIISELYAIAFASTSRGRGASGVLHILFTENSSLTDTDDGQEKFGLLHDMLVGVLCTLMDSATSAAATGDAFEVVERIVQLVQSAKLIHLATVLIRWGTIDVFDPSNDSGRKAGVLISKLIRSCGVEWNDLLTQSHIDCINGSGTENMDWLDQELPMIWKLCRQMCNTNPCLFLFRENPGDVSNTVLSHVLGLCLCVVRSIDSTFITVECGLSLHLMPLCTLFEQIRVKALCYLKASDDFNDNFATTFIPIAREMLFLLLARVLYIDDDTYGATASTKGIKQLFGQIFLLLLAVSDTELSDAVEPTQDILDGIFWPFCSPLFHSSQCTAKCGKVMSMHDIHEENLPALPMDTELEMSKGVFLRAESGELQYVNAKAATTVLSAIVIRNQSNSGRRTVASQQLRNVLKALSEIEATFKDI